MKNSEKKVIVRLSACFALALCGVASLRAANDWYVSVDGDAKYDGSSPTVVSETVGPKKSFADLMPSVGDGDTIWVMPGEHVTGTMDSSSENSLSRVHLSNKNVTLRSYSGNPADTAIVGWGTESTVRTNMTAELVRCVSVAKTATGCIIDGLTLKDGVACCNTNKRRYGGGVDDLSSAGCWLIDCVITNCYAYAGGGVRGCRSVRTLFSRCDAFRTAWGSAMYEGALAAFCLFDRNTSEGNARAIGGDNAKTKLYNCTLTRSGNGAMYSDSSIGYTMVNCLSVGNTVSDAGASTSTKIAATNTVFGNVGPSDFMSFENCVSNITKAATRFIDSANGDYRVSGASPAAERGDAAALSAIGLPAGYEMKDFYGNAVPASGPIAAGCAIVTPPCVVVGEGLSAEGLSSGVNDLMGVQPESYTFVLSDELMKRPYGGLSVNGVVQTSLTVPAPTMGETLRVEVVTGTNWYVNAATGSDGPLRGGRPDSPLVTIRAATTNAVSGDVVHVAPGEYGAAEGSVTMVDCQTRVVVPAGVRVQADCAAGTTVIRGAAATEGDDYGNGTDAVRCVYLGENATIANFTLTDGHTASASTGGRGGAVYSSKRTSTVVDCLVTNNFCYNGTLYSGRIVRCRVVGNTAGYRGAYVEGSSCYGCFFDHSHSQSARHLNGPVSLDFCTIGSHHTWINEGSLDDNPQVISATVDCPMRNTVMASGRIYSISHIYATNSVLASTLKLDSLNHTNCLFLSTANMKLSDDYVPLADSPINNFGDLSLFPDCAAETDLVGVPRVLNGGVDAGAFEHDWRDEYAAQLGARHVGVEAASPVVTNAADAVELNGGTLDGRVVREGSLRFRFAITGAGTLTLSVNGETVGTYVAGETEALVRDLKVGDTFRFVHTIPDAEEGAARLLHLRVLSGLILLVK